MKIAEAERKEELERKMIVGGFILEKTKIDSSFKAWLEGEIRSSDLGTDAKRLFGI